MSPSELAEPLSTLARVLPEWSERWYVFGAYAVSVWGVPRLTADVDVTAHLKSENHEDFVRAMRQAGLDLRVSDVDEFVRRTRVLPFVHRATNVPVDVVLAGSELEEEFLDRARRVDLGGIVIPVISPEDLLVTKVLAGRPKDLEDIRGILRERRADLDVPRVRRILGQLDRALSRSDLEPTFERELRDLEPKR